MGLILGFPLMLATYVHKMALFAIVSKSVRDSVFSYALCPRVYVRVCLCESPSFRETCWNWMLLSGIQFQA